MPLYFAYGSNMDRDAMRRRCPRSSVLGSACLPRHRFLLMGRTGYASVRRDGADEVHGLLFDLALPDVPALDRYEDVAHGLYLKRLLTVRPSTGGARRALVYLGTDTTDGGKPPTGYMETIVAAAAAADLPAAYVARLRTMVPSQPAGRAGPRPTW